MTRRVMPDAIIKACRDSLAQSQESPISVN